ncbi:MAG: GNAT family N-acetyltransferase [Pirellulaceae bacterium]
MGISDFTKSELVDGRESGHISVIVRETLPDEGDLIFELRCDPRLSSMQYAPSILETPSYWQEIALRGPDIPRQGEKCSTILVNNQFAGYIAEKFSTRSNDTTLISLGWDLAPELWGQGVMTQALN